MSDSTSQLSIQTKTTPGSAPNGQGRGLFASSHFRPGDDVLHIQSPFVAVLDTQRLADTCSGCFGKRQLEANPDNKIVLKACAGCQVVKYCDTTCQAKDWKLAHSRECPIYKDLHPKILPINARAIMRMVLRLGAKKNAYTQEELDLFQTLETHIRDVREGNSEQWERISLTSKAVKQYSQTGIEEELLSAFGAKFDLNSFNLTNAFYDRVGLYIHPYAALINHSCEYNAVMGFDGPELYIKAVRPIAKDEQIFISYVDTTYPKRIRQKELGGRYFFACQCKKCSGDEPPEPTGDAGVVCERAFALLQSGKAGDDKHRLSVTLQALITCELPKTKQPFVSIFDEIIVSDISDGALTHAFLNCALRFSRIDPVAYPYEGHPIRAVHAWTLAKVTLQISQESPELTMPEFVKGGWEDFLGTGEVSLDYGLLTWTLLAELVSKEAEYCTVPGFRTIVKKTFANVHEEFMRHGLDPRNMRDEIRAQWSKLGKLISGYFQCVLRDNS